MEEHQDNASAPIDYAQFITTDSRYVFANDQFTVATPYSDDTVNLSVLYGWSNESSGLCDSNSTTFWKLTTPVCSTRFETFASFIIVLIVLTIITLATIIGNILVIMALYRYRSLRTMSNCLIGNLAISDLLLATTVMPISTGNDLLGYWVFGRTMCTMWLCMDVLYCTASIWGLCTIAFDRYTATVYPVWYHDQRSLRKVIAYVLFVWIFSIIISFAPFIGWQDMIPSFYYYNSALNRHECILFSTQSYVFYSAMGSFVLPACLMVFLYIRIFGVIRVQAGNIKARNHACLSPQSPTTNGLPSINSPDDNSIELNLTRENTALTCASEIMTNSTLYINGNTFNPSLLNINGNSNILDEETYVDSNSNSEEVQSASQSCDNLQKENSENHGNHLLVVNSEYAHLHNNGVRKSCSDAMDIHAKRPRDPPRSKSVNILVDLSSDDSTTTTKKPRKQHRFSLPWNLSNLERNHRMTLSMKRRFELREQRATKRMLLIMACFFVCWIPFLFMYITRSLCADCYMNDHLVAFIIWLGYANSGINPILYTLFNEDFRRAFKKILGLEY